MANTINKQNINKDSLINLISFHRLYFNEHGERYGWLSGCPWDPEYGLSIFLSGDKIKFGTKEDLFD